jgi:hypothetical protein
MNCYSYLVFFVCGTCFRGLAVCECGILIPFLQMIIAISRSQVEGWDDELKLLILQLLSTASTFHTETPSAVWMCVTLSILIINSCYKTVRGGKVDTFYSHTCTTLHYEDNYSSNNNNNDIILFCHPRFVVLFMLSI